VGVRDQKLRDRLASVKHVVAVMSGKGGVGKSAMTVNLATALAQSGLETGIVDADINGASVVRMTGVGRGLPEHTDGMVPPRSAAGVRVMSIDLFLGDDRPVEWAAPTQEHAYAWRGMAEINAIREMIADTAWGDMDYLFIDLPPGTDKLPNLLDVTDRLDAAVVVTIPSPASHYVVRKSITLARRALGSAPIFRIENMATFLCNACGTVHTLFPGTSLGDHDPGPDSALLGLVPFDPPFGESLDSGRPERASGLAAEAIRLIAQRLNTALRVQPQPAT
jgi:ATP-binding protein involved in chromosome partitioning